MDYVKDTTGAYFDVYIYEEHVVKIPKHKKVKNDKMLADIAMMQTELSKHLEEVLPCRKEGRTLIMPRAKGIRQDKLDRDMQKALEPRKSELRNKIKALGYLVSDTNRKNIFYDEAEDKMYLIDLHNIKVLEKGVEK